MNKVRHLIFTILFFIIGISGYGQVNLTVSEVNKILEKSDSLLFAANFNESLKLSKKALEASLLLENPKLITLSYNSIAGNLEEIHEEDQALNYYEKALDYSNQSPDASKFKFWIYNNMGNIYTFKKKNYDKGLDHYKKSFNRAIAEKDSSALVLINMNLAATYFKKLEYEKGIKHLNYSEKKINLFLYPDTECYLHNLLGIKYSFFKENNLAQKHFEAAIKIARENNLDAYLIEVYSNYSNHYNSIGDFENAFFYFKREKEISDKIFQVEKIKNADLLAMKIELEETKRAISKIESEKNNQIATLEKSKTLVVLFLVLLFVMSLLVFTLYKNNKFKTEKQQHGHFITKKTRY